MNNMLIYTLLILFAVAIIAFVVWKNYKDRKAFEQQQNQDYPKRKDEEDETPADNERAIKYKQAGYYKTMFTIPLYRTVSLLSHPLSLSRK